MSYFRLLEANEIDVRVASFKEAQNGKAGGCSLLLYKNARVDQNILDERFGIFGWQRKHEIIGGNLYCTVSVKDPQSGEWISKQDVGTESNTEKEKGQASDSFKRACFNLGIGRELYTAPFIWLHDGQYNESKGQNGKPTTYDRFIVSKIGYTDDNITELEITNTTRKQVVFTLGGDMKPLPQMDAPKEKKPVTKKVKTQEDPNEETPKEETPVSTTANGYPERSEMMKLAKEKYPDGSKQLASLLECWKIDKLEKATTAQLMVIWSKYGGK